MSRCCFVSLRVHNNPPLLAYKILPALQLQRFAKILSFLLFIFNYAHDSRSSSRRCRSSFSYPLFWHDIRRAARSCLHQQIHDKPRLLSTWSIVSLNLKFVNFHSLNCWRAGRKNIDLTLNSSFLLFVFSSSFRLPLTRRIKQRRQQQRRRQQLSVNLKLLSLYYRNRLFNSERKEEEDDDDAKLFVLYNVLLYKHA